MKAKNIIICVVSILALWCSMAFFIYGIENNYSFLCMLCIVSGFLSGQTFILSLNKVKKKDLGIK